MACPSAHDDQPSRFTHAIRAEYDARFEAACAHRFMREIGQGTLSEVAFARYVVQEYAFVGTAITVNAYALAKAPDADARSRLAGVIHEFTTTQDAYFQAIFDRLAVPPGDRTEPKLPGDVRAFQDFHLRVAAAGRFEEILAAVLGAEWLYETWCARAMRSPPEDDRLRSWIELHTEPAFTEHVAWLRARLDHEARRLDDAARENLSALFARTLELEIAFHDAVYDTSEGR